MKHLKEGLIKQRGSVKITPKSLLQEYDIVQMKNGEYLMYLSWDHAKSAGATPGRKYEGQFLFVNCINGEVGYMPISDYDEELNEKSSNWNINEIHRIINPGPDIRNNKVDYNHITNSNLKALAKSECQLIWKR